MPDLWDIVAPERTNLPFRVTIPLANPCLVRRDLDKPNATNYIPERIVIGKSGANRAGLQRLNVILKFTGIGWIIGIVQSKYLNNIVEQDHRFIKWITRPMLGFKAFHSAAATLAGIEVAHMIRKGQLRQTGTSAFKQFAALAG